MRRHNGRAKTVYELKKKSLVIKKKKKQDARGAWKRAKHEDELKMVFYNVSEVLGSRWRLGAGPNVTPVCWCALPVLNEARIGTLRESQVKRKLTGEYGRIYIRKDVHPNIRMGEQERG